MSDFVHLHLHSQFSLLDGAIQFGPLLARCKEHNMEAVAVTDHGNMFGSVELYLAAKAAGIRPILGCEVYVAPGSRTERGGASKSSEAAYHLVLLATNRLGYKNLCELVSAGYKEGFYYKPRVDWELLSRKSEGIICLSACLAGELPQLLLKGQYEQAKARAQQMASVFGENNFFLELQENYIAEQKLANDGLKRIAAEVGLPMVVTNDCHYLRKEDAYPHEVLLCIQTGKTMDDPNRMRFSTEEFYVKTPQEMAQMFPDLPEALKATVEIARRCDVEIDTKTYHFPALPMAEEVSPEVRLGEQAREGLSARFAEIRRSTPDFSAEQEKSYFERLETELTCINNMGFAAYLLIVADFINWGKDHDIPVGPGRGSAAGSLVCYALRITDLDPIPYNLLFERFLNPERVSMPDIDVDFCIHGRERVIDYVRETYGADKVAQIITFGTMAGRSAVRDAGRALNIPYTDVDKIAKLVPETADNLPAAVKMEAKLAERIEKDPKVKELFRIAMTLEGLTRHASTHAAGVVVTPAPLTDYLPLYVDPKSGGQVTQLSMSYVEKIGLVKFDFLGLKNLTVIDNCVRHVRAGKDEKFDIRLIPMDDAKAFELLQAGDTTGVFQLESSGMKGLLTKLKPTCFEDIIAVCALYRPGPLGSGMVDDFIQRKHGKKDITYEFALLEPILKDTYGVIVYQEQVMQIAQALAGYSLGGADLLRRAMGKKKPEEMAKERGKFLDGAKAAGHDVGKAGALFDLIAKFAEYGFNKSHSAAYALIAYQTAFLKAHYPVEFMAALLTEDMVNTDKVFKNVSEARAMGIAILPPDVNASESSFTVRDEAIRFGLGAIKGVGENALLAVFEMRAEGGPFTSLHNFCERVDLRKVNKKVVEAFIKSGAFDSLGGKRAQLLVAMETAMEVGQKLLKARESGQCSLFETSEVVSTRDGGNAWGALPDIPEWPERMRLAFEKEVLGFFLSGHPLQRYAGAISRFATCAIEDLADRPDRSEVTVCGMTAALREITTKNGARMAFVTIEDLSAAVEATLFTDVYMAAAELLKSEEPLYVKGTLEVSEGQTKILAKELRPLRELTAKNTRAVSFDLREGVATPERLSALREMLRAHRGECQVRVVLRSEHGETTLELPAELRVAASEELLDATERLLGYPAAQFF